MVIGSDRHHFTAMKSSLSNLLICKVLCAAQTRTTSVKSHHCPPSGHFSIVIFWILAWNFWRQYSGKIESFYPCWVPINGKILLNLFQICQKVPRNGHKSCHLWTHFFTPQLLLPVPQWWWVWCRWSARWNRASCNWLKEGPFWLGSHLVTVISDCSFRTTYK